MGRRRWLQTLVIGLVAAMAVATSVLGGALLISSRAPFDTAFADQNGAHLAVLIDAEKVAAQQAAVTANATGVAATAGPFPTGTVGVKGTQAGAMTIDLNVVGRADPGGAVDKVSLTEGRWATGPNEIVVSNAGVIVSVGGTLTAAETTLTVVGKARSMSDTADAWTDPATLAALTTTTEYQMLYRFDAAATATEMTANQTAVEKAVPPDAVIAARSWLEVRRAAVEAAAVFVPFLVAFGVLALAMSLLIVANVVTGSVASAVRRIGILKALGVTPGEVVRAYVGQALLPAAVGAGAGVIVGNLLAVPLLGRIQVVYGTPKLAVSWWVDVVVVVFVLGLVAVTGWLAALRAGRLRTVDALAVGRTSGGGRGRWAARLVGRLPVPRPVGIGLARPFARPIRAALLLAAIAFGTAAVTFSVGIGTSLVRVQAAGEHSSADIVVQPPPPRRSKPAGPADADRQADPAQVMTAISAQSGTEAAYGERQQPMRMTGAANAVNVSALLGDARWNRYELVTGRWYGATGEATAASGLMRATGKKVGDTITLTGSGGTATVTIVGEVFESGEAVWADVASVGAAMGDSGSTSAVRPNGGERGMTQDTFRYQIAVTDATDVLAYIAQLNADLETLGLEAFRNPRTTEPIIAALIGLATLVATLLAAAAALGVLNTLMLDLRDRVHDLGVMKAVGMSPGQAVTSVIASVVGVGLLGGAVGVPIGMAVHSLTLPSMAGTAGTSLPSFVTDVYLPAMLTALVFGGLVVALLGALIPSGWAARVRTATALRTE
ncbi:FtsX-like permease family protein [Plantactinospora solaniradicis]|uniref:FtsX-like permease family protein n=1 Tax=Plantactinospora solaniradicis TaxID=1723736 RepID=A0ABW1KAJ6_9ACTN